MANPNNLHSQKNEKDEARRDEQLAEYVDRLLKGAEEPISSEAANEIPDPELLALQNTARKLKASIDASRSAPEIQPALDRRLRLSLQSEWRKQSAPSSPQGFSWGKLLGLNRQSSSHRQRRLAWSVAGVAFALLLVVIGVMPMTQPDLSGTAGLGDGATPLLLALAIFTISAVGWMWHKKQ